MEIAVATLFDAYFKDFENYDEVLKSNMKITQEISEKVFVIPPARVRYLSEIAENNRAYDKKATDQVAVAQKLFGIYQTLASLIEGTNEISFLTKTGLNEEEILKQVEKDEHNFSQLLIAQFDKVKLNLDPHNWEVILNWAAKVQKYKDPIYTFKVRGKEINIETHTQSLSHTQIPKVSLPKYKAWGDLLRWNLQENVPGEFPFTAGLYPFKRTAEDPTRMFAGEGGPERTNRRFHYVS